MEITRPIPAGKWPAQTATRRGRACDSDGRRPGYRRAPLGAGVAGQPCAPRDCLCPAPRSDSVTVAIRCAGAGCVVRHPGPAVAAAAGPRARPHRCLHHHRRRHRRLARLRGASLCDCVRVSFLAHKLK